jgi:DNA replication and repair protein RecF
MHFLSLRLTNFRNISDELIVFNERLNILTGDNGQGKTNLIEALCLVSQGQSFRYCDKLDFIQKNKTNSFIESKVEHKNLEYYLSTHIDQLKKSNYVQKKAVSSIFLKQKFPIILFSPESLSAIKDGSEQRRNLIDEFLIMHHVQNTSLIRDFKKILKSRNVLLKNNKTISQQDTLQSIEKIYLEFSIKLTLARHQAICDLSDELSKSYEFISGDNHVDISVEMSISGFKVTRNSKKDEIINAMHQSLSKNREKELLIGASIFGPHRHEINFVYNQNNSRFFCSQGQQRTIILSFKIAQIVYHRKAHGFYPVLMLDDVLSELDVLKRKTLISFLNEIKTQVFLTATDLSEKDDLKLGDSRLIRVESGKFF